MNCNEKMPAAPRDDLPLEHGKHRKPSPEGEEPDFEETRGKPEEGFHGGAT
jgi:hypothetical protein